MGLKYTLLEFVSALLRWAATHHLDPKEVFFYVCFFCNNQHRIMVEQSKQGSDNLELLFEARLKRINRVVALVDTWENPWYTQRVWCIYEQYEVARLGIPMQFTMPPEPAATLMQHIELGKQGIDHIVSSFVKIDAASAKATMEADEHKVKNLIRSTVGFAAVNSQVTENLTAFIGEEVKGRMDAVVEAARASAATEDLVESLGMEPMEEIISI